MVKLKFKSIEILTDVTNGKISYVIEKQWSIKLLSWNVWVLPTEFMIWNQDRIRD